MPTLSSISGTFGYGRSPQNLPAPGFAIYPPIGTKKTWSFATDGMFAVDALTAGNCYVITPNTSFSVYIKLWGAGGGSGNAGVRTSYINGKWGRYGDPTPPDYTDTRTVTFGTEAPSPAGAGGFSYGQLKFQGGQPYTIFAGGAGARVIDATQNPGRTVTDLSYAQIGSPGYAGQGGAASGVLVGNVFEITTTLQSLIIAGGGGGADLLTTNDFYLSGAGGGDPSIQSTRSTSTISYTSNTNGASVGEIPSTITTGTSGLPTLINGVSVSPQYYGGINKVMGGPTWNFNSHVGQPGGGGGGVSGGKMASGGLGMVNADDPDLHTSAGVYSITPKFDDSNRGTAGDSDCGGRLIIYFDEYKASNITATGGTITNVPIPESELAYKYHTFNSNDVFSISSIDTASRVDVFVVGGGGGASEADEISGGGGGVAFKSKLKLNVGNYIVDVGTGGEIGNKRGNKGKPSAFYTNSLATKGFPDSYVKLINSFGGQIKYININGDNTDGLTQATGYTSFNSALASNLFYDGLIVFVVLQGIYGETVSKVIATSGVGGSLPTPIHDQNQPRIFVCAPGKVTIQWTPSNSNGASPMCQLMHPLSAVYGAIFDRIGYTKDQLQYTSLVDDLAFFRRTLTGFSIPYLNYTYGGPNYGAVNQNRFVAIFRGSLFNCVFKDTTGDWGLFGEDDSELMDFTIKNCTFVTKTSDVAMTSSIVPRTSLITVNNCIFSKSMIYSIPNKLNTAENAIIGTKFVVAAHTDKGVYAGEYGWSSVKTTPIKGSTPLAIVGHGGGGGARNVFLDLAICAGGSGGGTIQANARAPSTQYNVSANLGYSAYGYAGAAGAGGGGGAGYPGVGIQGGIGIEFPENSGTYYGSGGSRDATNNITYFTDQSAGLGGGSGNKDGIFNGRDGIVMIRYIVAGPYTSSLPTNPKNIIAYGGITKTTSTYREHVFTTSGTFELAAFSRYIDVIVVGGGGSGAYIGPFLGPAGNGGGGGQVKYQRVSLTATRIYTVTIGNGALPNEYAHRDGNQFTNSNGLPGGTTSIADITSAAGGGGGDFGLFNGHAGVLITDGLFSDNTTYYGSGGAGRSNPNTSPESDQYGTTQPGGGGVAGSNGVANTGGGGGSNIVRYGAACAGGSGIVIIRYPITLV